MLKHRVIPALLLNQHGGLVKTTKFTNPKYIGDPLNAIRIFNTKEVDELMVLDIEASKLQREPNYALIEQFAGECFMPLCYGGGIRTIDQAYKIFKLGVEKICLQTAVLENLQLVRDLVDRFGSSAIVVSVDVKKDWLQRPKLFKSSNHQNSSSNWLTFIRDAVDAGAGEILLNAVDKDGTLLGPDLVIIEQASKEISAPLIALGGIASLKDIKQAVEAGASAVAAGAFFVFHGPHRAVLITYPQYQELLTLFNTK
ncbi:imidazole glycerol phosphate synthase subunit HisF [Pedobacter polaris]|uniref:imidazole glycerol-phosphate synthase n=1 Tax=Pedobacter polaris TaxID=2571273 RepID=A0A4U1CUX4_9SPHI|nr:AglZ/HisF2 family acetamidino modification protein [Pedobacter polaris]TKC13067.1 imidazole glycerol phosphate synthase subunit HisF [Pedobacter polaris]